MFRQTCVVGFAATLLCGCSVTGTPPQRGFIDLFNGKNLIGWTTIGRGNAVVEDGLLRIDGGKGEGAFCYAERPFHDFVLVVEWMVPTKEEDSGVYLRIPGPVKTTNGREPAYSEIDLGGYEVQIHDGSMAFNPSGMVIDVMRGEKSFKKVSKPPGEWNLFEITALGQKYTVVLNGGKMHEFTGRKATEGYIGIQIHSRKTTVYFRRIRVRELASEKTG